MIRRLEKLLEPEEHRHYFCGEVFVVLLVLSCLIFALLKVKVGEQLFYWGLDFDVTEQSDTKSTRQRHVTNQFQLQLMIGGSLQDIATVPNYLQDVILSEL